ncbi:MAG TPA: dockerin type I repeat-containing protein [Tepidisphaeraceae bacterium]|jgi:hypothetical protein
MLGYMQSRRCAQAIVIATAFSSPVFALNFNRWEGNTNSSDDYNNYQNWSESQVPNSTDQATIYSGSAVLSANSPTLGGMLAGLSGQFFTSNYKLTCSGTVDADSGGEVYVQYINGGSVGLQTSLLEATNGGFIELQYSNSNAKATNVTVDGTSNLQAEGTLTVSSTYTNKGTLTDYGVALTAGTFTMGGTSSQPATISVGSQSTSTISSANFNLDSTASGVLSTYSSINVGAFEANLTLADTSQGFDQVSSTLTVGNTAQLSLTQGEWQFNNTVNLNGGTSVSAAATINDYAAYTSNMNVTGYANMVAGEFDGGAAVNIASGAVLYVGSPYFRGTAANHQISFTGAGTLDWNGNTVIGYSSNGIPSTTVSVNGPIFNWEGTSGTSGTLDIQNGELDVYSTSIQPRLVHLGMFIFSVNGYDGTMTVEGGSTLNIPNASWTLYGTMNLGPGAIVEGQSQTLTINGINLPANTYSINPNTNGSTLADIKEALQFNSGVIYMQGGSGLQLDGATTYAGGSVTSAPYLLPPQGSGPLGLVVQNGNATVTANTNLFCNTFDMDGASNTTTWTIDAGATLTQQAWFINSPATAANLFHSTMTINGGIVEMETNSGVWTLAGGTVNMNVSGSSSPYLAANELILGTGSSNGTVNIGAGTTAYIAGGLYSGANSVSGGNVVNVGVGSTLYISPTFGSDANAVLTKNGPGTMIIESGDSQTHGSGSVINVNQGELDLNSNAINSGNPTLNLNVTGTVKMGSDQRLASLHVLTGGAVDLLTGANKVLRTSSLTIDTGGTLDITNDGMIVDYTGSSPLATIGTYIASAYDNGAWDQPGLTSSTASVKKGTAIGYADNNQFHYTTFDNQSVSSNAVLIKYTWYGDLNLDGKVTSADLALMSTTGNGWSHGDLNYDGKVNSDDYSLFMLGNALQDNSIGANVPEPTVIAFAIPMIAPLMRRRRA